MLSKVELYEEKIISLLEEANKQRINNLSNSIKIAEEALSISREISNNKLTGKSLNQLALYFMIIGEYKLSTKKSEEAILFFEKLEDEKGIADSKYNIAAVHYKTDNYHLGLVYFHDALKIYQKQKDYYNQSRVQKSLGTIYEFIQDQENALKAYKNAIKNAIKIGDLNLESNVYNNLSGILIKKHQVKKAMKMIENSISIKKKTNDVRGFAYAIYGRGKVYLCQNKFIEAEADFLEAIKIHKEMGEKMGFAMAYNKLGELYLKNNLLDKANNTASESLALSIKYNNSLIKIKCYNLLFRINKKEKNDSQALSYFESYLKEKELLLNAQSKNILDNYDIIIRMKTLEKETELQKERQRIIEKKNKDEEESVRIKQEFLSIMSHEVRTPLNAITTIVSMLTNLDTENKKLVESLQFASNNLINIVNDILDFNKLDFNKAKLETNPIKFNDLCHNITHFYEVQANEKGLQIDLKIDVPTSKIYLIDETKITQILSNLLSNAIKFTEKGKIEFSIKLAKEEESHDILLFNVKDSGEGISEENVLDIFESFSQIKPIMTRKQGGTGLGLAIVKKLIELHQSTIEVKSELEKGSEFYFKLRLEKTLEQIKVKKEETYNLKNKIALLAEDTPMNALLMTKLLAKWGIETDHVVNGKLAYEKTFIKKYDFILMDIHMPEMNGFESTKLIRNKENLNNNTPIFAVTADITTANSVENTNLFNGVLWKPLKIEKLYTALSENCEKTA